MNIKATHKVCAGECKKRQALTEFYHTMNPIFEDNRIPYCKGCVENMIDKYGFKGFQSIMKIIDKPILRKEYNGNYKEYLKRIQAFGHYKDRTYEDSDLLNHMEIIDKVDGKDGYFTAEEINTFKHFWGDRFKEDEYHFLETEWHDYLNKYDVQGNKSMEIYVKEICLTQLEIRQARADGKNTRQLIQNLNDLMTSANLKPLQETAAHGTDQETFGTLIQKIENEMPIPEPLEEWKDVDGIGKLMRVWFTGMLKKSFGLENPYQKEFDVEIEKYTIHPEKDLTRDDDDE